MSIELGSLAALVETGILRLLRNNRRLYWDCSKRGIPVALLMALQFRTPRCDRQLSFAHHLELLFRGLPPIKTFDVGES
jgi:hypothetical protein